MKRFGDVNKRVLSEIQKLLPYIDLQTVYWKQLKILDKHILIMVLQDLGDIYIPPEFLAFSSNDTCIHLNNPESLPELLKAEDLTVSKENCKDIIELFDLVHHDKMRLNSIYDLKKPGILISTNKLDKIQVYEDIVHPPIFTFKDSVSAIKFWTIDHSTGNLEQWHIFEKNEGEIYIKNQVIEIGLIKVIPIK